MKHWNRGIGLSNWSKLLVENDLELSPSLPNCSKDSSKLLPLLISINWPSLVTKSVVVQKIYSKMHPVSCTYTHHDVTDLVNHVMIKTAKTWISWLQKISFLQNKKIFNLSLRWHIVYWTFLKCLKFDAALDFILISLLRGW